MTAPGQKIIVLMFFLKKEKFLVLKISQQGDSPHLYTLTPKVQNVVGVIAAISD